MCCLGPFSIHAGCSRTAFLCTLGKSNKNQHKTNNNEKTDIRLNHKIGMILRRLLRS